MLTAADEPTTTPAETPPTTPPPIDPWAEIQKITDDPNDDGALR
jgi:hypothetical protein